MMANSFETEQTESLKRTYEFFAPNYGHKFDLPDDVHRLRVASLVSDEYDNLPDEREAVDADAAGGGDAGTTTTTTTKVTLNGGSGAGGAGESAATVEDADERDAMATDEFERVIDTLPQKAGGGFGSGSRALVISSSGGSSSGGGGSSSKQVGFLVPGGAGGIDGGVGGGATKNNNLALAMYAKMEAEKPEFHAPWQLMRVVSGHTGWVRCIAVDPSNEWFATGSADRTVKIWDLASGKLKLSLTGHISTVRGVAISGRLPYLFSVGDDKMVKCWDLEVNRTMRSYHGHLSGVYCVALHPTIDVLITGSRDATLRVWDIRSKACVHVLGGHKDTVWCVAAQAAEPQIISGGADQVVRTWDLATGKTISQLTHHKKQIRALTVHPTEYAFVSAGADNIKKWKCPESRFMLNFTGHNAIVNTVACNGKVLFSGGDNGSLRFWDWRTGYCFQREETIVQPGSLDAEAGIYASTFDMTGSRLITCEADKTIKFYKENENATPETHPIAANWRVATKKAQALQK